MKIENTVTCDNGHEEISFVGRFSALCPLCALREQSLQDAAEAREIALQEITEARDAQRTQGDAEENRLNEQIALLQADTKFLSEEIKRLQKQLR